jgi:1-acyl-sn-glycerol-3-phosphate acyltransferase
VKTEVRGLEHVVRGVSYVVVANHRSNIDVMVGFAALPIPIRYLAKQELFRVPILAQAMRAIGIVEVDRQKARGAAAIESVNRQSAAVIERGHSLIIYPEGTRSRDGAPKPFKKGAFTMAAAAGMPVLPVAIAGSRHVWRPGRPWIHPGTVVVTVDPPMATSGPDALDAGDIRERAREIIESHLQQVALPPP